MKQLFDGLGRLLELAQPQPDPQLLAASDRLLEAGAASMFVVVDVGKAAAVFELREASGATRKIATYGPTGYAGSTH